MILPLLLLILAAMPAAVIAYGVNPFWGQYPHGIELIVLSRRLQWPMLALTVILCLILIGLIVAGRRRAWWLIGLAPILTLLAHHFALDPDSAFLVNGQPGFVSAEQAILGDEDWVVGLVDGGEATAYPFAALYPAPVLVQTDQQAPLLLLWSAFANRALAVRIDRSIKARDLEIVSMPANTLLVYNSRLGQFINGVTGLTLQREKPAGFGDTIPAIKTTWKRWKTLHPQTRVLVAPAQASRPAPSRPLLPYYPMPAAARGAATVAMICTTRPAAVLDSDLTAQPKNFPQRLLLLRSAATGCAVAFDRQVDDLFPIFQARRTAKYPEAVMVDADSKSLWSADGRAVAGPLAGRKLHAIDVDDGVYLGVLRVWYPDLPLLSPLAAADAAPHRP